MSEPFSLLTCRNTTVQPEEDSSVAERMRRLQEQYVETGMRRSVDAVIVCHVSGVCQDVSSLGGEQP